MTLTRLLVRRHRVMLGAWLLMLIGLCGGTVSSYQNTYATEQQRRTAVELAQSNQATTLLYGRLPDPGTPAQMFAWELGAIVIILTAVMAVLITVSVTRAAEDDGTLELVRGCGVAQRQPLHSALSLLTGLAVVLALGCAAAAGLATGRVDGVTWPGAMAFGVTIGLTFLIVSTLTVVLAQVAATAGQARMLGLVAVGASFALRAFADVKQVNALNWLSPLGLRSTVEPFTAGRWWATVPAVLAAIALAVLAELLAGRREFGAGFIRRRDTRSSRVGLRTPVGLATRLGRSSLLAWTVAVAAIGTLFASMGSGTVQQSRNADLGGFLGSQLGAGDPAAAYLAYCDTVVGIVVCAYAVLSVLASRRCERDGLTDLVLTTGVRRWVPLAAQTLVTAAGCATILVATGALSALITPTFIEGDDVGTRAFAYAVGQWPATVATAGYVALLIGISPRLAGLAWLPLGASALLALLGNLLDIPQRVQDLGFFRHVPDIAGPDPRFAALLILTGLGLALSLIGFAATTRRDIVTG
jgi:ABC-2 type transport system permease protein